MSKKNNGASNALVQGSILAALLEKALGEYYRDGAAVTAVNTALRQEDLEE